MTCTLLPQLFHLEDTSRGERESSSERRSPTPLPSSPRFMADLLSLASLFFLVDSVVYIDCINAKKGGLKPIFLYISHHVMVGPPSE